MSSPLGSLKTAGLLIFGLFMIIAVANAAYADTPESVVTVDNETVTQQVGEYQAADGASDDRFVTAYDNETVYNASGTELEEGVDYVWNDTDATILFKDTARTSDGGSADVSYAYDAKSADTARFHGIIKPTIGVMPVLVFVGVFLVAGSFTLWGIRWITSRRGGGR